MLFPFFGSSRSFSQQADSTILRDLNGFTFTDMPWLIESPANSRNKQTYQRLWPKASDNEYRLFALGFDALNVALRIDQFAEFPYTVFNGKSGDIYLGENNHFICLRHWATYKDNKVLDIAMD